MLGIIRLCPAFLKGQIHLTFQSDQTTENTFSSQSNELIELEYTTISYTYIALKNYYLLLYIHLKHSANSKTSFTLKLK